MTTTFDYARRGPSKGPKVLFTLGGVAVAIGVVMVIIGSVLFGSSVFGAFDDGVNARENLETEIPVPGTGEVFLTPDNYDIVAIGTGLLRDLELDVDGDGTVDGSSSDTVLTDFRRPTVTVTTSEGRPLTLRSSRAEAKVSSGEYDLVSIRSFTVTTAGTYVIETDGEPGAVASVGVGPSSELDGAALARAVGGGLLFMFGILAIIGGIFFLAGGGVWRFIDRTNRQGPPPGPPAGNPLAGWMPPVMAPTGRGPVKTSTYPPTWDPPGPQTPAPPPLPPPPWEPPQSPIS